jgi:iron(III) transport system ATP-binding protein
VVAIRPQGVLLAAPGEGAEGLPGRVVSRHFLGEVELFDVAVEGSETYLTAKGRAGIGFGPGAEVRVTFDPRDVLVFPAGD